METRKSDERKLYEAAAKALEKNEALKGLYIILAASRPDNSTYAIFFATGELITVTCEYSEVPNEENRYTASYAEGFKTFTPKQATYEINQKLK